MDNASAALTLVPCGDFGTPDLRPLAARLARFLSIAVATARPIGLPADSYNPKRNQHHAGMLLDLLADLFPDSSRVVGITPVDIFLPIFTHVYGEAQMPGRAAIVSLFRLGGPDGAEQTLPRALKVCIHELLHTFEITHCHHETCLMRPVTRIDELDRLAPALCRSCRNLWEDARGRLGRSA